jgi:DNA polymerase-3 subunit delta
MPRPETAAAKAPLYLICGEDDFAVRQRARQLYYQWCDELGGMDHETIDGSVNNSGEALQALARLREALQTLPFFGSGKAVWLRDCNFLADDRVSAAKDLTEQLASLADELKTFEWRTVRLLVSAGKVDKRKSFFKTLDKLGTVEELKGWSLGDKDWADQAEQFARRELRARGKEIAGDALAELVQRVGPNARLLANEVEKLALYAGDRAEISLADVAAISISNKFARAFAFADALGNRNLPELLRCLDEELWQIRSKVNKQSNEFGLLYGLITKVRAMLQLKEMVREGWLKPTNNYNTFKTQLERVPADALPEDRRYNPLALNVYVLFRALPQAANYSQAELIRAMDLLLECNQKLIFSNLDEALVLQQTLVEIVGAKAAA